MCSTHWLGGALTEYSVTETGDLSTISLETASDCSLGVYVYALHGIAEVKGSNPVEALIFFRLLLSKCLNWKIYCDDHSCHSSS